MELAVIKLIGYLSKYQRGSITKIIEGLPIRIFAGTGQHLLVALFVQLVDKDKEDRCKKKSFFTT